MAFSNCSEQELEITQVSISDKNVVQKSKLLRKAQCLDLNQAIHLKFSQCERRSDGNTPKNH